MASTRSGLPISRISALPPVCVSGCHSGRVLAPYRGLVHLQVSGSSADARGVENGDRAAESAARYYPSF